MEEGSNGGRYNCRKGQISRGGQMTERIEREDGIEKG